MRDETAKVEAALREVSNQPRPMPLNLDRAIIELIAENRALKERCKRLARVADAAHDYGLSNDIGDELYEALDALEKSDLDEATT